MSLKEGTNERTHCNQILLVLFELYIKKIVIYQNIESHEKDFRMS